MALRKFLCGLFSAMLLGVPAGQVSAVSRGSSDARVPFEADSLRSIATWLKGSGRDGYLAAEVADTVGIPRKRGEEVLEAKQRGYRTDNVLRIAQVPSDERRDFLLFMVQRPEGEVYFYLSTVREGLKKAFLSIPGKSLVVPLEQDEAQSGFQQEVVYWQDKVQ
ncbi:MAG TPA: hypothetical protein VHL85_07225 [Burkholderiales bacterium]|jgi:hypothetical protein|nr:hypothetical protein [Burkholderiales bacterium]